MNISKVGLKIITIMSKQVIKIELNGKIIGTKPLILKESLIAVRDKIKDKVTMSYIFLENDGKSVPKIKRKRLFVGKNMLK